MLLSFRLGSCGSGQLTAQLTGLLMEQLTAQLAAQLAAQFGSACGARRPEASRRPEAHEACTRGTSCAPEAPLGLGGAPSHTTQELPSDRTLHRRVDTMTTRMQGPRISNFMIQR